MIGMQDAAREDLAGVARDFLRAESSSTRVRAVVASGTGVDRDLDAAMAGLGWFAIEIPEEYGGAGAGFADMCVLLEGLGATVAASSLISSAVLCAGALLAGGSSAQRERWLPTLATGATKGAAVFPIGSGDDVRARVHADGWRLTGTAPYVLNAPHAELLIVVARADAGHIVAAVRADADGVAIARQATTDGTRCLGRIDFDDVAVAVADVLSVGSAAETLIDTLVNRASVAVAADSVGLAGRVLEMTTRYAVQREQFGRPIGSFQAVKHRAADMLVEIEAARGLVEHAAGAVAAAPSTAVQPASMAKEYAAAVATEVAGAGVQLHGGIGYTWEHDLHLFLKRASLNESLFGSGRWHRRRAAQVWFNSCSDGCEGNP